MTRKLKVFGANLDGRHRIIMATTSLSAFRAATGTSRNDGCETGNEIEIGVALNEPGVMFVSLDDYRSPYRSIGKPPLSWARVHAYDDEQEWERRTKS